MILNYFYDSPAVDISEVVTAVAMVVDIVVGEVADDEIIVVIPTIVVVSELSVVVSTTVAMVSPFKEIMKQIRYI